MELVRQNKLLVFILISFFSFSSFAKEGKEKVHTYSAPISCQHCVDSIEKALRKSKKVKKYSFDLKKKEVYVVFDDGKPLTPEELKIVSKDASYPMKEVKKVRKLASPKK